MKKGLVKITPQLICSAIGFPPDWKIESILMNENDEYATAVISGSEFPEEENGKTKECVVVCHKESIRFEVQEVKENDRKKR
jgi:hypothetical protein